MSSIAVAQEVAALGGAAVACVNSRDRNLLGFRRDLLTAAAYGVNEFLSSTVTNRRSEPVPPICPSGK